MWAASSVARKRAVEASSSGGGMRPAGVAEINFSRRPVFQASWANIESVSMKSGAKALTLTVGANAFPSDLVKPRTPYFPAAY